MNQHHWTCLTTVLLTTAIAPIGTVHAKNLSSSAVGSVLMELHRNRHLTANVPNPTATRPLFKQSIGQTIVTPTPVVRPDGSKSTIISATTVYAEIAYAQKQARSIDLSASHSHANIATPVTKPFKQSIAQTIVTPTSVVRPDGSKSTIVTATTVQAEVANTSPVKIARAAQVAPVHKLKQQIARVTNRKSIAHAAPSIPVNSNSSNLPKNSRFETGLPQYIFDNGRPQQIVATTIAQVGTEIGSAESSMSIPVRQPESSIIPNQLPANNSNIGKKTESPNAETAQSALDKVVATQTGKASWYGSEAGSKTANGERYDPSGLTAAHRTLPFGTKVRVTSLTNGKMVVVRINDRGPFNQSRMIDVSAGAAAAIGIKADGVDNVRMEVLSDNG
jgi:rare lipoprotein A